MNNISQNFLSPHRTAPHPTPIHFIWFCPHPHHTFFIKGLNFASPYCKIHISTFRRNFYVWFFGTFWGGSRCGCWTYFFYFLHLTAPAHRNIQNFCTCARAEGYRHVRKCCSLILSIKHTEYGMRDPDRQKMGKEWQLTCSK